MDDQAYMIQLRIYSRSIKFEETGCNQMFDVAILTIFTDRKTNGSCQKLWKHQRGLIAYRG